MKRFFPVLLLSLLYISSTPRRSEGVFGVGDIVYDPTNHATAILSNLQVTISAIQSVLHSAYMVIDLTGIDAVLGTAELAKDLATMSSLLSDARALAWDFRSIAAQVDRLFNLDTAPNSTWGMLERQRAIDRTLWEVYGYAVAVETLIATISHTIDHMRQFWDRIGVLVGNRSALQSLNEGQAKMVLAQEKQALMTAAFQRAEAYQRLQEPLQRESAQRITDAIMFDMPGAK